MLGPFLLKAQIGSGGMAQVWRAVHAQQGVEVAIKILGAAELQDARRLGLFKEEARAAARLNHPGIVRVLDYGQIPENVPLPRTITPRSPYLVMELVSHGTLREVGPKLRTFQQVKHVLLDLLDALAHAHARDVIHRDIKPPNVLRDLDGGRRRFKLTDFGIARALDDDEGVDLTEGRVVGTPHYMAPEQIDGQWRDQGPWTDLYALGCVAWELLCGRPPFDGDMIEILKGHMSAPLPALAPRMPIPEGLGDWLHALLMKAPEHRTAHAADAAAELIGLSLERPPSPSARQSGAFLPPPQAARHTGELPATSLPPRDALIESSDRLPITPAPLDATVQLGPEDEATLLIDLSTIDPHDPHTLSNTRDHLQTLAAVERPREAGRSATAAALPETWRREDAPALGGSLLGAGLGLFGLRPAPMVAREAERDHIWDALRRVAAERQPHALVIEGASGTGKTRLARWLGERAAEVGAAQLLRVTHSAQGSLHDGIARALGAHMRVLGLPPEQLLARVRRWLQTRGLSGEALELRQRAVAELLWPACGSAETRLADAPVRMFEFGSPQERLIVFEEVLTLMAQTRPVLLLVDDAQWGPETLELVERLMDHDASARAPLALLTLATVRAEARHDRPRADAALERLADHPSGDLLTLEPLSAQDHLTLITQLLGFDGAFAQRLATRTHGNPLFAIQLVGELVERGDLEVSAQGFRPRRGATIELPDDLHHVWAARIDSLLGELPPEVAEDARQALELAAVLGIEIDAQEWRAACQGAALDHLPDPDVLRGLLVARGLAVEHEAARAVALVHAMLRESLLRTAREAGRLKPAHQIVADALRRIYPLWQPGVSARIANHLIEARALDEATELLYLTIQRSHEQGQWAQVEELLARYKRLLKLVRAPEHDVRWGRYWSMHAVRCSQIGDLEAYRHALDRALDGARKHQGWDAILARVLVHEGFFAYNRGEFDACEAQLLEAHRIFTRLGARHDVLRLGNQIGEFYSVRGNTAEAHVWFDRVLDALTEEDAPTRALTLINLASLYQFEGRFDEAEQVLDDAIDQARALHMRTMLAKAYELRGILARERGDDKKGYRCYSEALRLCEEIEARRAMSSLDINAALTLIALRRWKRARFHLDRAATICAALELRIFEPFVALGMCCVHAAHDQWDDFDVRAQELREARERADLPFPDDLGYLAERAGEQCALHDRPDRARPMLEWAVALYTQHGAEARAHEARLALAAL